MARILRAMAKPMTGRFRVVVLLLIAGTTHGAGQTPQVPAATFRATVEYVEVDAVVTDSQGRVVTDLRQDDVQVFEDGAPQTISTFSLVNVPIEVSTPTPFEAAIEPDVRTNERPFDGRVYVMVLDDLHVGR